MAKVSIELKLTPRGEGKLLYCVFADGSGELFLANDEDDLNEKVKASWGCDDYEFGHTLIGIVN